MVYKFAFYYVTTVIVKCLEFIKNLILKLIKYLWSISMSLYSVQFTEPGKKLKFREDVCWLLGWLESVI